MVNILPYTVGIVHDVDGSPTRLASFSRLADAENYIGEFLRSIDPEGVASGKYYLDGPDTSDEDYEEAQIRAQEVGYR